jgi:endonuclease/exonuclease/phosphatase family metal-dependent hydrolase
MPKITEPPPAAIAKELKELQISLDEKIPSKQLDRNLLVATWNIRAFGGLTEKWKADPQDSPQRDLHALACIAEIISRFDVIAIQEVKGDIKALRHTLKKLGPDWGLILNDVTKGSAGNSERSAFVFDRRRVKLSGLAAELVIPKEQLDKHDLDPDALDRQFARTPYAVSFQTSSKTFILVTLHIIYGGKAKDRVPELKAIAEWLADWARDMNSWDHNLIALGDFNIDREGDELYQAFTSTGLFPPFDLFNVPRSIFDDPSKPEKIKSYDQIAWFGGSIEEGGKKAPPALSLEYSAAGYYDFLEVCLKSLPLTKAKKSWRLSDHFPLWVEFMIRE